MKIILKLAWRNLGRNRRRTVLTAATVALGLALLLVTFGLGDGSHLQMIDNAVRMGSGHVLIQHQGYHDHGGVQRALEAETLSQVRVWIEQEGFDGSVQNRVERVFSTGLASSADGSTAVRVIGSQPGPESEASKFGEKLVTGEFLSSETGDQAVVGAGVARKLRVGLGSKFVVLSQASGSAELQSRLLRVHGILRTGMDELDQRLVIIPLEAAQELLLLPGQVHQVAVFMEDVEGAHALARRGRTDLPASAEVLDWAEAMPELIEFIRMDNAGNYLFNGIFLLLIAFVVLNTLMMSALERRREYALLDALGLSPAGRFLMMFTEAVLLALFSTAAGLALGYGAHLYLESHGLPLEAFYDGEGDLSAAGAVMDPVLYSRLSNERLLASASIIMFLTMILALVPAWRAGRRVSVQLLGRM
ncbi:MAG: ABC transporter permease [Candidatus Aminicenantes bacterium]|nr:ABC transporter permease [Candidatus Aminicenantes bacterium]